MYARAVDDAASRLRELRHEEWEGLAVGALALALALCATQVRPSLAVPLFLGGLVVGGRGLVAGVRRWDLVDRLVDERDAYVIAEVRAHAAREATMARRRDRSASIRSVVAMHGEGDDGFAGLAARSRRSQPSSTTRKLDLDPACAVACARLVDEEESLLRAGASMRARVEGIRAGFTPAAVARRNRRASEACVGPCCTPGCGEGYTGSDRRVSQTGAATARPSPSSALAGLPRTIVSHPRGSKSTPYSPSPKSA